VNHSLEEIFYVERQLQQAMLNNDVQVLKHLLHDELVFTDQTGNVVGKQADIASHASKALQLAELKFVEAPIVRLHGETAIVAAKTQLQGTFLGTPIAGLYRYLRVWSFQAKHWQIIAGNVSIIA
jgi:ketosteroid isomerase-like protein